MIEVPHNNDKNSVYIVPKDMETCTLSEYVRQSVENYFSQLNGHDCCGLYAMVIAEVEKPLLETVLKQTQYNQTKASKLLGLSRSTLRKKLEQYGIQN